MSDVEPLLLQIQVNHKLGILIQSSDLRPHAALSQSDQAGSHVKFILN
jgi:hypothetical protein